MPDDQAPGTALHLTISARSSEADILVVFGPNSEGGGRFGMCMGCMPVIDSSSRFPYSGMPDQALMAAYVVGMVAHGPHALGQ